MAILEKKAEKNKKKCKSKLQRQKWTPLAQAGSVNSAMCRALIPLNRDTHMGEHSRADVSQFFPPLFSAVSPPIQHLAHQDDTLVSF